MSFTWHGIADCDECGEMVAVSFRLEAERKIVVVHNAPGWTVRQMGNDDSGRDVDAVDLNGDSFAVYCPRHGILSSRRNKD